MSDSRPDEPWLSTKTRTTLAEVRHCAASWEAGVRLLGDVRASEIVAACDEVLAAQKPPKTDTAVLAAVRLADAVDAWARAVSSSIGDPARDRRVASAAESMGLAIAAYRAAVRAAYIAAKESSK